MESEAEYIFNYMMRQMMYENLWYNWRPTSNAKRPMNNLPVTLSTVATYDTRYF